jgi:C1A family cysteine protease
LFQQIAIGDKKTIDLAPSALMERRVSLKKAGNRMKAMAVGAWTILMAMLLTSGGADPQPPQTFRKKMAVPMTLCDCQANARKFDARDCRVVPPARYQEGCGSCWAFAAAAAFEISYCIVNPDARPADVDVSEQHILSCAAGSCIGTLPEIALRWMKNHRIAEESAIVYQGRDFDCPQQNAPTDYITQDWGYVKVSNPLYPSRQDLKEAICRHGSVISCMTTTDKFHRDGWGTDAQRSAIFRETPDLPTNHVVTLVGWDDDRRAWLVRNSWGTRGDRPWGMDGYCWIGYGCYNIGYDSCWVDAKPKAYKRITVKNRLGTGGFNTDLTVSYDVKGFRRVDKNNFPVGESRTRLVPEHARNIKVTAKAVGGKTIFSKDYATPQDLCFEVWGAILSPRYTTCYDKPSVTKNVVVNNLINVGTYVTKLTVTFTWDGQDYREERTFGVGAAGKVEVPEDAVDLRVKADAVAGRNIFNYHFPTAVDVCFDVFGTTLSPQHSACTLTSGCYKHFTFKNRVGSGYAAEASVTYSLEGRRRPPATTGSFGIGAIRRIPVPCEAVDITVVAKAIGGRTIFTKRYPQAVDRCYEVWGATLSPHYQFCDDPTDCKRRIVVHNSGAYAAEFTVKYDFDGERQTKVSGSFPVGQSKEINIPCEAVNIEVKAKAIGGRTIFTQIFPTAVDACWRVRGTTLQPRYESCR